MTLTARTASLLQTLVVPRDRLEGGRDVRSPLTGEIIAHVDDAAAPSVSDAVRRSEQAFARWRAVPAPQRGEFVRLLGEELRAFKQKIQDDTIQRFETPFDAPSNWWQVAFRLDASAQAWLITDPDDGHVPPLTSEGQARQRGARQFVYNGGSASYEDRSLYDRCITRGFPTSGMPTIYGNSSRIVQGPGYIAIQYEMIHETRVIPIDREPRPHVSRHLHLDMGDSRAHWEGDTLVVETTNFNARSVYRNANPDTLKITEHFTRIAPDKLRWSVTMDDPKTWTRPWTFAMPLTMNDAEPIQLYECHEGNYGLRNILSAARAEEREAAAATKP